MFLVYIQQADLVTASMQPYNYKTINSRLWLQTNLGLN